MVALTNVLDRVNNKRMNTEQVGQQETHITVFFDTNGSVTAISRSAIYLLGYSESELLGLHALDLFYHSSDLFRFVLHSDHHEVISNQAISLRHKEGSVVTCIVTALRPMLNISGSRREQAHQKPRGITSLLNFLTNQHWENEKQYFNSLAVYLSNELQVDQVFIGYFNQDSIETVEPITVYTSELFQSRDNQLLEHANFQNIIGKDAFCFVGGIQEIFPHNTKLNRLQAESFASITLRDSSGKAIGVLSLVSRQYFQDVDLIKTILQIVSLRTASELQNYLKRKTIETQTPSPNIQEYQEPDNTAIHELRDLISTVNTSIYMLKKKPEDLDRGLKSIETQLAQVSALVQKLHTTSSNSLTIEDGQNIKIDLNLIAANVIAKKQDIIHKKRIDLEFLPATNPANILGNPAQIERVIAKLLSNAIQHTLPQSYILVEIKELSSQILFRVFDTGIGDDNTNLPNVFRRFHRQKKLDNISRLDMSIIKDFVYQHYGQVEIDSDPEQGNDVRVYFPHYHRQQTD